MSSFLPPRTKMTCLGLALLAASCTPSRSEVFGPVATSAQTRTGYDVKWRSPMMKDSQVRGEVDELLADGLTADEAIRIGMLNNRRLQGAFDELGIARGELATASVLRNPEVEGSMHFHDSDDPDIEIEVVQDVMSLIAIGRRRGVASTQLEAARMDAIGAVVDLVAEVKEAYYTAQVAEQKLVLRQTIAEATEASYLLAQKLREAGNITALDLLRERDLYEQSRIDLIAARSERLTSREQLNSVLGLWGEATAWTLPGQIAEPPEQAIDIAHLEREAIESSLELEAIRYRLRAAGDQVGLARLDRWLPELGVGVSAERDGEEGHWGVGPAIVLEIPLWDRNGGNIARSEATMSRQQHQYAAIAIDVRAQARAAGQRLDAARQRVLSYRNTLLPLRAELLEQTLAAHNAMAVTTFEVLAAKRRQIEASSAYLDALRDYWLAQTAVEQLRAGRRPGMATAMSTESPGEQGAATEAH